jgi:serine/threonine protein kinase
MNGEAKNQSKYILSKISFSEPQERFKTKKLLSTSSESIIYKVGETILKIPKSNIYVNNLIRSYYIGNVLNNLICKIPNFVYTTGIYKIDGKIAVSQDFVRGETFEAVLPKLSLLEFLNIFIQILFALEVAQREYKFCHYDLHLKNIILKPVKTQFTYSVMLDKRYDITVDKYIPVIIDFGFASVHFENKTIGSYDFPQYGMMNFLVPGYDMYKLLFHSYVSNTVLHREIGLLFLFYGEHDPYKMLITPPEKFPEISKTYLSKVTFSRISTYTPLEFIKWIRTRYSSL